MDYDKYRELKYIVVQCVNEKKDKDSVVLKLNTAYQNGEISFLHFDSLMSELKRGI